MLVTVAVSPSTGADEASEIRDLQEACPEVGDLRLHVERPSLRRYHGHRHHNEAVGRLLQGSDLFGCEPIDGEHDVQQSWNEQELAGVVVVLERS